MIIGIMGAMPEEVDGIKAWLQSPDETVSTTIEVGGRDYCCFTYGAHSIVVVFSRWGKVASASTATTLIDKFSVETIVFTGVSGAVNPALNIADIVIGTKTIQHDMDVSPLPGMTKYQIPLTEITYFDSNPRLVDFATKAAEQLIYNPALSDIPIARFNAARLKVTQGTLASGDQFITDKTYTAILLKEIDSLQTVDMESAAVHQVCYDHSVPFVAVRIVSDKADESSPINFPEFISTVSSPLLCLFIQLYLKELTTNIESIEQVSAAPANK